MTPMPPACAMAMASRASVTVSIAEEMIGRLSAIERVRRVATLTPLGITVEWPGRSSTSSNASPSGKPPSFAIRHDPYEMCGAPAACMARLPTTASAEVHSRRP